MTHPHKRKSRELAVQVLFTWDANAGANATSEPPDEGAAQVVAVHFCEDVEARADGLAMARSAWSHRKEIDEKVEFHAPQWPVRRQPGVDRAILRLAVWEMLYAPTPKKVVLDEAIEIAKHFSTQDSPAFVNGVLDAVLKEISMLTAE